MYQIVRIKEGLQTTLLYTENLQEAIKSFELTPGWGSTKTAEITNTPNGLDVYGRNGNYELRTISRYRIVLKEGAPSFKVLWENDSMQAILESWQNLKNAAGTLGYFEDSRYGCGEVTIEWDRAFGPVLSGRFDNSGAMPQEERYRSWELQTTVAVEQRETEHKKYEMVEDILKILAVKKKISVTFDGEQVEVFASPWGDVQIKTKDGKRDILGLEVPQFIQIYCAIVK